MSHSYQLRTARGGIVALSLAFTFASLGAVSCEHAAAVRGFEKGITPDGYRNGPRYVTQGLEPNVALVPTETVITTPAPPAPLVVAGDETCGDMPVKDLYVAKDEDLQEAQDLLDRMLTVEQRVVQLTGQDKPNYSDSSRAMIPSSASAAISGATVRTASTSRPASTGAPAACARRPCRTTRRRFPPASHRAPPSMSRS